MGSLEHASNVLLSGTCLLRCNTEPLPTSSSTPQISRPHSSRAYGASWALFPAEIGSDAVLDRAVVSEAGALEAANSVFLIFTLRLALQVFISQPRLFVKCHGKCPPC
jgi:hypothetical protein